MRLLTASMRMRPLKILAITLLSAALLAGCGQRRAPTTAVPLAGPRVPAPEPSPPAQPSPPPVAAPDPAPAPAKDPSEVRGEIFSASQPWISAPARLSFYDREFRIRFSGPVRRESVEEQIRKTVGRTMQIAFSWASDREATFTFPHGCWNADLSAAGALDAEGRPLQSGLNPALEVHSPCHGGGYMVTAVDQPGRPAGWPNGESAILDVGQTGLVLGRMGTLAFLYDSQTGTITGVIRSPGVPRSGRVLTDGRVVLVDGPLLRIHDQKGAELQRLNAGGVIVTAAIAGNGLEALLVIAPAAGEQKARVVRSDLPGGSMTTLARLDRWETVRISWPEHRREAWISPALHLTDIDNGGSESAADFPTFSPDGRWMIRPGVDGILDAAHPDAPVVAIKPERGFLSLSVWSPDSRLLLLPDGRIFDMDARSYTATVRGMGSCGSEFAVPQRIWTAGATRYVAFVMNCH